MAPAVIQVAAWAQENGNDGSPATSQSSITPVQSNGGYPDGIYNRAVPGPPTTPTQSSRPTDWPSSPAAPAVQVTAQPPYGPQYEPSTSAPAVTNQAPYTTAQFDPLVRQPALVDAKLCEGAQILARVGNDVVLTSDVLAGIDDLIAKSRDRIPADQVATQRAAVVTEVRAGIQEYLEHINDADPAAGISPQRRGLIQTLIRQQIEIKLIYQDFRHNVPKEALPNVEESVSKHFVETQQKALMKREKVASPGELESALRAKGSSLDREKRTFMEQIVSQQWIQKELKLGDAQEEVTHEDMRAWYQAHLKDFEKPARARWEEISIAFARHPTQEAAYAAMAALGNQVLAGASFPEVAKASSDGVTGKQGGVQDWTTKGSLTSEELDKAIFTLPPGQLSQIVESKVAYHIIRVVERQDATRTSFLDAQKEVKESIKKERMQKAYKEFVDKIRKEYPVWTIFDNPLQQPRKADEDDRYSSR